LNDVGVWTPDGEVAAKPSEESLLAAIVVKVEMTLTAPNCPSAQELPVQVQDAVMAVSGVTSCTVETVWDPPWDPSRMSEEARLALNMF